MKRGGEVRNWRDNERNQEKIEWKNCTLWWRTFTNSLLALFSWIVFVDLQSLYPVSISIIETFEYGSKFPSNSEDMAGKNELLRSHCQSEARRLNSLKPHERLPITPQLFHFATTPKFRFFQTDEHYDEVTHIFPSLRGVIDWRQISVNSKQ